eukprot:TRINITY_DN5629_c0_g2_i2.p1 TRINITY_DN5629_c0_g2~~TRINITY_DN5629_c0_g2_i2.p1  ORF type:complete len:1149 (+),score=228.79 TRINITY_DN5629_c0_g2_i2:87-3533(+)
MPPTAAELSAWEEEDRLRDHSPPRSSPQLSPQPQRHASAGQRRPSRLPAWETPGARQPPRSPTATSPAYQQHLAERYLHNRERQWKGVVSNSQESRKENLRRSKEQVWRREQYARSVSERARRRARSASSRSDGSGGSSTRRSGRRVWPLGQKATAARPEVWDELWQTEAEYKGRTAAGARGQELAQLRADMAERYAEFNCRLSSGGGGSIRSSASPVQPAGPPQLRRTSSPNVPGRGSPRPLRHGSSASPVVPRGSQPQRRPSPSPLSRRASGSRRASAHAHDSGRRQDEAEAIVHGIFELCDKGKRGWVPRGELVAAFARRSADIDRACGRPGASAGLVGPSARAAWPAVRARVVAACGSGAAAGARGAPRAPPPQRAAPAAQRPLGGGAGEAGGQVAALSEAEQRLARLRDMLRAAEQDVLTLRASAAAASPDGASPQHGANGAPHVPMTTGSTEDAEASPPPRLRRSPGHSPSPTAPARAAAPRELPAACQQQQQQQQDPDDWSTPSGRQSPARSQAQGPAADPQGGSDAPEQHSGEEAPAAEAEAPQPRCSSSGPAAGSPRRSPKAAPRSPPAGLSASPSASLMCTPPSSVAGPPRPGEEVHVPAPSSSDEHLDPAPPAPAGAAHAHPPPPSPAQPPSASVQQPRSPPAADAPAEAAPADAGRAPAEQQPTGEETPRTVPTACGEDAPRTAPPAAAGSSLREIAMGASPAAAPADAPVPSPALQPQPQPQARSPAAPAKPIKEGAPAAAAPPPPAAAAVAAAPAAAATPPAAAAAAPAAAAAGPEISPAPSGAQPPPPTPEQTQQQQQSELSRSQRSEPPAALSDEEVDRIALQVLSTDIDTVLDTYPKFRRSFCKATPAVQAAYRKAWRPGCHKALTRVQQYVRDGSFVLPDSRPPPSDPVPSGERTPPLTPVPTGVVVGQPGVVVGQPVAAAGAVLSPTLSAPSSRTLSPGSPASPIPSTPPAPQPVDQSPAAAPSSAAPSAAATPPEAAMPPRRGSVKLPPRCPESPCVKFRDARSGNLLRFTPHPAGGVKYTVNGVPRDPFTEVTFNRVGTAAELYGLAFKPGMNRGCILPVQHQELARVVRSMAQLCHDAGVDNTLWEDLLCCTSGLQSPMSPGGAGEVADPAGGTGGAEPPPIPATV